MWPIVKKVWWCPNCNIPTLVNPCPRCGGEVLRLPLSDPGDARPAFERDYKHLRDAYRFEFDTETGLDALLGRSVMILNKAPYFDEMKEVIVDGVQIGRLYFDPLLKRWRFRLSKAGALRVLQKDPDIVDKIVVEKKRYIPMDVIRVDKELKPRKQVLLVRSNGKIVGLGYAASKHRVVVHSWWGDDSPDIMGFGERKSDLNDVIAAHRNHLYVMESKAKKLVATMAAKTGKEIVTSFSGGKDSLVALHIVVDLGLETKVLFNNTGIELPETVDTVYKVVDKLGLELIEASAGDAFWHAVYKLGVPGRDYRWCCKVCKLAPLARTVKRLWSNGALNVVGQRAFESLDRARNPSVWRLRWAPQLLNVSPINYWSQLEVWLYIFDRKLYVNPLYFMGYERIGCFMCPASTLAELVLVEETHRDLWAKWLEVLEYWAKRMNMPREWIDYALWRWNAPARYRTLMAKKFGVVEQVDDWRRAFSAMAEPRIVEVRRGENSLRVCLDRELGTEFLDAQITVLNPASRRIENGSTILEWSNAVVRIVGSCIEVTYTEPRGVERAIDVLKAYYRYVLCVGCRACEANCPFEIFRVEEVDGRRIPRVSEPSKCIGCKMCLYNCPVAEVYVEHVVAPLIFDDAEAWRRKTREHHQEVLKKIKKLLKQLKPEIAQPRTEPPKEYAATMNFFDMLESSS